MDERKKKLLFIGLFVLAVIGIGYVLYAMFFRALVSPTSPDSTNSATRNSLPRAASGTPGTVGYQPGGTLPNAANGTGPAYAAPLTVPGTTLLPEPSHVSVVAQNVTLPVAVSRAGGNAVRVYNANDGKFYSILDDGTRVPLSNTVFPNVSQITWGNKSEKAVIGFPDGSQIIYDFGNDRQATIPRYWEDTQFSPNDDQIATKSVGNNPTNRFLVIANSDGSQPQAVEDMGNNQDKVQVSWSPNNQTIAFSQTGEPLGADRQQILLIGKHQENQKGLVVEGRGFIPNWSPDGTQLLYSVWGSDQNYSPVLWLSGAEGDQINANRRQLNVSTWADKCTWQNATVIICGIPKHMPDNAGLQRSLFDIGPDSLVKIDLANGQIDPLPDLGTNVVVSSVQVSSDGNYAFVTDGVTHQLIKVLLGNLPSRLGTDSGV